MKGGGGASRVPLPSLLGFQGDDMPRSNPLDISGFGYSEKYKSALATLRNKTRLVDRARTRLKNDANIRTNTRTKKRSSTRSKTSGAADGQLDRASGTPADEAS